MHKGANYGMVTLYCSMFAFWQVRRGRKWSDTNYRSCDCLGSEFGRWVSWPFISHCYAAGRYSVPPTPFCDMIIQIHTGQTYSPCLFFNKIWLLLRIFSSEAKNYLSFDLDCPGRHTVRFHSNHYFLVMIYWATIFFHKHLLSTHVSHILFQSLKIPVCQTFLWSRN